MSPLMTATMKVDLCSVTSLISGSMRWSLSFRYRRSCASCRDIGSTTHSIKEATPQICLGLASPKISRCSFSHLWIAWLISRTKRHANFRCGSVSIWRRMVGQRECFVYRLEWLSEGQAHQILLHGKGSVHSNISWCEQAYCWWAEVEGLRKGRCSPIWDQWSR